MTMVQPRLMNLKVDFAFKQLFGQAQSQDILIAFLNALLKRTETDPITEVQFANTEYSRNHQADKESRLDVLVRTNRDEWVNIEIQVASQKEIVKRGLFYWATVYQGQAERGRSYERLHPTIGVFVLDFKHFSTERFHTSYHVYEDVEHYRLSDDLQLHFVELPKLPIDTGNSMTDDPLTKWLWLLQAHDHPKLFRYLEVEAMADETLHKAFNMWEEISRDPENWAAYISRDKFLRDQVSIREEAREEGLEEGRQKGRQEGADAKALEVALNLLAQGVELDVIVKATGLSREKVEELQKQQQ